MDKFLEKILINQNYADYSATDTQEINEHESRFTSGESKPAFTLAEVFLPFYSSPHKDAFTLAEVFSPFYSSPNKNAFTLAEVLITLGIIGVVAAMTMPTLLAKYQEKVTVTRHKKAYSIISQAYLRAQEDYGTVDNWGFPEDSKSETDDGNWTQNEATTINQDRFTKILS